jgi:hypothetical protein
MLLARNKKLHTSVVAPLEIGFIWGIAGVLLTVKN